MSGLNKQTIRVAILDLYEGVANEGMRCIRQILKQFGKNNNLELVCNEFDVRLKKEVPGISYDIFISTGGPGSPLESKESDWEKSYFNWLEEIIAWNNGDAQ